MFYDLLRHRSQAAFASGDGGNCTESFFSIASLLVAGRTLYQDVAPLIGLYSAIRKPS